MNVFLITCLIIFNVTLAVADDDDKPVDNLPKHAGPGTIFLDAKAQPLSGLEIQILVPASHHPEFAAYGIAVNLQPLVELRHRYLVALTERGSATAKFKQADQDIRRQQDLFRDGAASKRNLQVQQAQWQSSKAQVDASGVQGQAIIDEAKLIWGNKLAEWAFSSDSDLLGAFLSGRQTLLQIALPANKRLADDVQDIYVEASGNRSEAIKAGLISAAPQTDNTVQGESYFFQANGGHIRTGMRVAAWIPEKGKSQLGVVIPKSALIWFMDQAFVYVKTGAEHFSRRLVEQFSPTSDGYFVSNGINAGEQLVVTGGQMLLSEEFRGQIPNEDD